MTNQTIKAEARDTFERALALFRQNPSSQAYLLLKDAALQVMETKNLPDAGMIQDVDIAHRTGTVTVRVLKLEALREDIL